MGNEVTIYDTTLRDGAQAEDIHFTAKDKLRMARILDRLGVDYIEMGWPGSSGPDREAFSRLDELDLGHASVTAIGMTHKPELKPDEDGNLEALLNSGADAACLVGKSWKDHVHYQLKTDPQTNLTLIDQSIRHLRQHGMEVFYDAEHLFDGFKDDRDYALECLRTAARAGAQTLVLCDTNGGTLPDEYLDILKDVHSTLKEEGFSVPLGVHNHNDTGTAVWNSLVGLPYIDHIQGTLNGFGERCGNADLCQVIPNLAFKREVSLPDVDTTYLKEASDMAYNLSNTFPNRHQPYVGDSAFAHGGGIHADAKRKGGASYEQLNPEKVGNRSRTILSGLGGRSSVVQIAQECGFEVDKTHPSIDSVMQDLEDMEDRGYEISSLPAERYLLMHQHFSQGQMPLSTTWWRVTTGYKDGTESSEAVLRGSVYGYEDDVVALGDGGPVRVTYTAMQKLISPVNKEIYKVHLSNYKVRIAEDDGANSSVRVYVEFNDNGDSFSTVGVSPNILEASREAVEKGFCYYLLQNGC